MILRRDRTILTGCLAIFLRLKVNLTSIPRFCGLPGKVATDQKAGPISGGWKSRGTMIRLRLGILLANQSTAAPRIFEPSDIASVQVATLSPRTRRSISTFRSYVRAATILPLTLRYRQKSLRLQRFTKPQDCISKIAVSIHGKCQALLAGQPLATVGAVVDADVDDLASAEVVNADSDFFLGVLLKLRDKLA
jgi:hypothetical protein